MQEYPTDITAGQWWASPLRAAPADDDALRAVATAYLRALYESLSDWSERAGGAVWPDKFKTLDDRLSHFGGKVKLALESADGPRDLTSAVLTDFECTPSSWAHAQLSASHRALADAGVVEVFGLVRRELPMLVADVGAAVRESAAEKRASREARESADSAALAPEPVAHVSTDEEDRP